MSDNPTSDNLGAQNQGPDLAQNQILDVKFTGTAKEYFGIWIVNILLSILTLGIYSAWAKVRRKRYFNGNTWIAGHNFEYHANPVSILKGRIIVFVLFVAYNLTANLAPEVAGGLTLLLAIVLPWLINKGLSFNARMTSYRNVRFGFEGSYWKALLSLVILPFVGFLSLGLLLPLSTQQQAKYIYSNHSFGDAKFNTHFSLKPLYKALLISALLLFGSLLAIGLVVAGTTGIFAVIESLDEEIFSDPANIFVFLPFIVVLYLAMIFTFILPYIYYSVRSFNLAINHLTLDGKHKFGSNVEVPKYAWILISNLVVTLLTLGLMAPWAHVRKMKYLAAHFFIQPEGSLDEFVDRERSEGNVASSEYMDLDGIDFGL